MDPETVTPTKIRIQTAMTELLRRQGYGATSMSQISAAAHAPVGSLYHHFPGGKAEIARAALAASGTAYVELVLAILAEEADLAEAIRHAFATAAENLEAMEWINLCPVVSVAAETVSAHPELRETIGQVLDGWLAAGAAHLESRGLPAASGREIALVLVCSLEGAFTLARTLRSPEPLHAAGAAVAAYAEQRRSQSIGEAVPGRS